MKTKALANTNERITPLIRIHNGKLKIEGVLLEDIYKPANSSYGTPRTPLYIYSRARIEENYKTLCAALQSAFSKKGLNVVINYACKANTNPEIMKILRTLGANIDAVTREEIEIALLCGFKPTEIFYTGVSNSAYDLNWIAESGIQINFDDPADLDKLTPENRKQIEIASFRVIPNVSAGHHAKTHTGHQGSKFGIPQDDIIKAYKKAKSLGFEKFGIHCHIGSGSLEIEPFVKEAKAMVSIIRTLKKQLGIELAYIDLGGGFGVPYKPDELPLNIEKMAEQVAAEINSGISELDYSNLPTIHFEPGRYIVCDAGVIVTTVNTVKKSSGVTYALVDASMATLLRPAMYDSYHHIIKDGSQTRTKTLYTIAGRVCESGDIIGENRMLPKLKEGDVLVILNAGAYGYTMALGTYNSIGLPEQIIVEGNIYRTISNKMTGLDIIHTGQTTL